jgi:hypothetical protein
MSDWSCHKCSGLGMLRDDEHAIWSWCDCPTGESKAKYWNKTPAERRRDKAGRKKKARDDEPVPDWVKE